MNHPVVPLRYADDPAVERAWLKGNSDVETSAKMDAEVRDWLSSRPISRPAAAYMSGRVAATKEVTP